jgi:hypothetical protein
MPVEVWCAWVARHFFGARLYDFFSLRRDLFASSKRIEVRILLNLAQGRQNFDHCSHLPIGLRSHLSRGELGHEESIEFYWHGCYLHDDEIENCV